MNVQGFAQDSIPIDFGGGPPAMNVEIAQDLGNPSTFGPDTEDLLLMEEDYAPPLFFIPPPPVPLTKVPVIPRAYNSYGLDLT